MSTYKISCEVATEELKDSVVKVLEYLKSFGNIGASRELILSVVDNRDEFDELYVSVDGDGPDRFVSEIEIEEIPDEEDEAIKESIRKKIHDLILR